MRVQTLDTIPRELYFMVLGQMVERRDVKSLCEVSRQLCEETVPYLYWSIPLYASGEDVDRPDASAADLPERCLLRHTRHIKFWSHFDTACEPTRDSLNDLHKTDQGGMNPKVKLEDLVRDCETGALRSLDWAMRTCVPQSLLGPAGYFTRKQQNLEAIRLVTDPSCSRPEHNYPVMLCAFPRLKRLYWSGLSSHVDLDTLADILELRSHQLEVLEVDLVHYRNVIEYPSDEEPVDQTPGLTRFVRRVLRLPARRSARFPALKRLGLASVWIAPAGTPAGSEEVIRQIASVLDLTSLRSLKLWYCNGWESLLIQASKRAARGVEPPRLKSLEISWVPSDFEPVLPHVAIERFLEAFEGLEELFLDSVCGEDPLGLWTAAQRHRATLRRFVHHKPDLRKDDFPPEWLRELPDVSFFHSNPFLDGENAQGRPETPLGKLDLTSLGLRCSPQYMGNLVAEFSAKRTLQVLHMRESSQFLRRFRGSVFAEAGDDDYFDTATMDPPDGGRLPDLQKPFVDFAQWAFGPAGIGSLRLLAYGDFFCDGRFPEHSLLLCRREVPSGTEDSGQFLRFREVRKGGDLELWELYRREEHMLTTCPDDPSFRENRRWNPPLYPGPGQDTYSLF